MPKGKRKKKSDLSSETFTRRQRVEGTVYRDIRAGVAIEDEDERIIRVSFSSDEPYLRKPFWDEPWIEVLGHKDGEIDFFRLDNRATVHYNHSRKREDRIGAVLEASSDGHRTEALLQLSPREDINDIWIDVAKQLLCNVSVGYQIHERILIKHHEDAPDEFRVVLWEPLEISLVDIPADPTVGVGRGDGVDHMYRVIDLNQSPDITGERNEGKDMPTENKTTEKKPAEDETRGTDTNVVTVLQRDADVEDARKNARDETLGQEKTRCDDIRAAFDSQPDSPELAKLLRSCLENQDCDINEARDLLLKEIGKDKTPSGVGHFQPGEDAGDKFRIGAVNSIQVRAGVVGVKSEEGNQLRGYTLTELARACLTLNNLDATGDRSAMIGRALTMRASPIGLTPSDFGQILADVASKSVLLGFSEAMETWRQWCRVGNLTDFKQSHRVGLSEFEDLELIGPGGEYKYGKFSDRGEVIQLGSYGKIFPLARQSIINDDLQVFTAIPSKMGRASARLPGDLAYAVLVTNPNMSDGVALFHANHNNIGTGGPISVASVGEARELMALQTDVSGNANGLNTTLGFILVPIQLEDTANVLRTSEFDPDDGNNSRAPNPRRNTFEVVADPRLSADSAVQWYGVAGAGFDTVEVAFLDGVEQPRIEEKAGWTVDGAEFKVALDCAAAPMEHRSFVRNAGA